MPKLLWMSPYSLHDDYSSAAINCKLLLESLARIGWEVCACTSFILEDDSSEDTFASLKNTIGPSTNQVLELEDNKVHYVYIKSHTHQEEQLTLHEMQVFFDTFCEITDNWRPDFVLGFGTSMLFQTCMAELSAAGFGHFTCCSTAIMLAIASRISTSSSLTHRRMRDFTTSGIGSMPYRLARLLVCHIG